MSSLPSLPTVPSVPHLFDEKTTTNQILEHYKTDLTGKFAIVTGGYSGIGTETTRALLSAGANVLLPARTLASAQKTAQEIEKSLEGNQKAGKIEVAEMDLSSLSSVRAFAEKFLQRDIALNLLINNAGIMALPKVELTEDGFEQQFATNHLGHFLLTNLLLPALRKGAPSRVVVLSSFGHTFMSGRSLHLDDVNFEKNPYEPFAAYGRSKLSNILFARKFDELHKAEGIRANSVHPGLIVSTGLARRMDQGMLDGLIAKATAEKWDTKSPEQGAATTIYVAVSPDLQEVGGQYFENTYLVQVWAKDAAKSGEGTIPEAFDDKAAAELWDFSVKATKL